MKKWIFVPYDALKKPIWSTDKKNFKGFNAKINEHQTKKL